MKNLKRTVCLSLPIAVVSLVVPGGCASLSKREPARAQGLVEAPDMTPLMTPAQRDRRYRAAYNEGVKLAGGGRYGLALRAFDQALALKPLSVEALFNLGACHEAVGDPLRAVNIYRRVLEINPRDPDCYANLGTSFIKMYYREKSPVWRKMAREAWRHSLALNADQPDVEAFLARSETLD